MRKMTIATFSILALLIAACGESPADGSGATIVEEDAETEPVEEYGETEQEEAVEEEEPETEEETDTDVAFGTRDNPLDLGTAIQMGDWTFSITDVNLDATDEVLAENQFNDPPADGRQFVMFNVDATYEGEESGTAWMDFSMAIVGGKGNTFSSGSDDRCGVIPDGLRDHGETFPGGSVSGNVCFSVPADQLDGATIRVEESFSFDDSRAFYTLQ